MTSSFRCASSPRRKAEARRSLRKRILVVCGGVRTEQDYFNGLRDYFRSSNVIIKVRGDSRSPLHVVQKAADIYRSGSEDFDECWAVFDVDRFEIGPAVTLARKHNVQVAVSNPCFEYWLLLHFCDHGGYLETKAVIERMQKYVARYDKARIRFADYESGVEEATRRARRHDDGVAPPGRNPNTRVWRIVEQVMYL